MTLRIGVFTDYIGSYGRRLLQGVAAFANTQTNLRVVTLPFWTFAHPPAFADLHADGVIAAVSSMELLSLIQERGIPAVNVASELETIPLACVMPDDQAIGRLGAQFFLDRHFESFAFIGWGHLKYGRDRARGFAESVEDKGFDCRLILHSGGSLAEELNDLPRPTAVMVSNDTLAFEVLNFCREAGLHVPEHVAILGVDDDDLVNAVAHPQLASITLPAARIGYDAAALLLRLMNGEVAPDKPQLHPPGNLIVRASADIFAVEDPDVAEALRFIRDHAARPIQVAEVIRHVNLSRRTLERRFREHVGRTPHEEIQRMHVERAKRLLTDTDLLMPSVAKAAGFGDDTRFNTVFRGFTGTTPTAYRQRARLH